MKLLGVWIAALGVIATAAHAQQTAPNAVNGGVYNSSAPSLANKQTAPFQMDASGNLKTTTALSGFAPATTGTPISVTTGGVTGTLPAGTVTVATNVGTANGAYCKLGASATTSDQYIAPNGGWFAFTVGAATQLTCITSTSTTTVNMVGGAGLPTGTGGGGGSGGGAVTIADGADVAEGAVADAAATAGSTGTVSAKLRTITGTIGTAGSPTTNMFTVQGVGVAQGSTTAGQTLSPIGCRTLTSAPTDTTAQTNMPSCTTGGAQRVDIGSVAGTAVTTSVPVTLLAGTTGGCTPYHLSGGTTASTNSTLIKNAAGTLCGITAISTSATLAYLKVYNLASAPTCSSATGIVHVYPIPASATGAGVRITTAPGEAYGTGIGFCVTGGGTDTDNTNAPTGIFIEGSYK